MDEASVGARTLLSHVYPWRKQHSLASAEQKLANALSPN
jgi:hypothetical protein